MFIALVFLAHIYVDLIVSATNVLVVFLSTINKHFLLLLTLTLTLGRGSSTDRSRGNWVPPLEMWKMKIYHPRRC